MLSNAVDDVFLLSWASAYSVGDVTMVSRLYRACVGLLGTMLPVVAWLSLLWNQLVFKKRISLAHAGYFDRRRILRERPRNVRAVILEQSILVAGHTDECLTVLDSLVLFVFIHLS